jgi:hypothetical protein
MDEAIDAGIDAGIDGRIDGSRYNLSIVLEIPLTLIC